jgi:TRAP-type C4-dicarboxylate transport system permease small subunit
MAGLVTRLEDIAAKTLLAVIVVLVFGAALARTLGHPLIWSVDMAQLLFVWLCFLGANRALRLKGHVGVDYFVRRLPFSARQVVELALGVLTLALLLTLAVAGWKLTLLNWQRVYGDSGISYAWVTSAVPAGCLLLAITVAGHMIGVLRHGGLVFRDERAAVRSDSQLG